ncbi:MAG: SpoIIE family protein phosphatase [Erysipelotrichaceae bacterium]|nr:SpoIIE family protein phosphatase [Erysipelotrichaceae bacterium]
MVNNLYTDIGHVSINHVGEMLCGDNVTITDLSNGSYVVVLADGLGSGVKANILSTLTSTMLSKMVGNGISIEQCVETIIATLPVCKDRGVAYSTFSVVAVKNNTEMKIYNYDNPSPFIVRNNKAILPEYIVSQIHGKRIEFCDFKAEVGDCVFMMSDGVIHAGAGEILNYGWELPEIMKYMEGTVMPDSCAKVLATTLIDRCNALYASKPGDDVTCACVRIKERKRVNLMMGPSTNPEDDEKMVSLFMSKKGMHIVCGGTKAKIVARCLNKEIYNENNEMPTDIPPMSRIEGIDLVTEGMITMNRVLEYGKNFAGKNDDYFNWYFQTDGASRLASILFEEATDVDIFSGCAINPAHQNDPSLSISLKMKLVDELTDVLKKLNKTVKVNYY